MFQGYIEKFLDLYIGGQFWSIEVFMKVCKDCNWITYTCQKFSTRNGDEWTTSSYSNWCNKCVASFGSCPNTDPLVSQWWSFFHSEPAFRQAQTYNQQLCSRLPETNSSPKRKGSSSNHQFSGAMYVSFGEGNWFRWHRIWIQTFLELLVGGWTNPFEKYARQIGSFSQFSGWK